ETMLPVGKPFHILHRLFVQITGCGELTSLVVLVVIGKPGIPVLLEHTGILPHALHFPFAGHGPSGVATLPQQLEQEDECQWYSRKRSSPTLAFMESTWFSPFFDGLGSKYRSVVLSTRLSEVEKVRAKLALPSLTKCTGTESWVTKCFSLASTTCPPLLATTRYSKSFSRTVVPSTARVYPKAPTAFLYCATEVESFKSMGFSCFKGVRPRGAGASAASLAMASTLALSAFWASSSSGVG